MPGQPGPGGPAPGGTGPSGPAPGGAGPGLPARVLRSLQRAILGVVMTMAAAVAERRIRRALGRDDAGPVAARG